ncbi:MAG: hypothetical protein P1V35_02920 [Planctomycetota bacterium]|nr:hypothetical protein [Planctomycetota bacterium]
MASLRRVRALLVGMVVAFVLTLVVENMVFRFFPAENQTGEWTQETMAAYVGGLPTGAFILMIVGWCLCIFAGGMMACLVGLQHLAHMVGVVTMAVLAGSVANFVMVDYPRWVVISTVFAGLITGLLTYSLAEKLGLDRERQAAEAAQTKGKKVRGQKASGAK